jgi:hypothetical protein
MASTAEWPRNVPVNERVFVGHRWPVAVTAIVLQSIVSACAVNVFF